MTTRFKICWVCATVSGLWLLMSALVAWNIISLAVLETPIALLMGGSVVGIAYQSGSLRRKAATIAIGMPAAYILLTNLIKVVVFIELTILLVVAYALFAKRGKSDGASVKVLEKQMKQCC